MTKKIFINSLNPGDSVYGELFVIKSYVKKASRNNKPYIDLEITDKTGTVKGKIWADNFLNCEEVKEGDVVELNATVDEFNGPQLNITNLKKIGEFKLEDFQQCTSFDIEEMWADVQKTINDIKNSHIKGLLINVFSEELTEKFKKSAAAYRVHHAYVGGLLEHTWEMLKIAKKLKPHFPKINMDIVNAGVILHDIGKIDEFEISTTITLTDEGKLLGHVFTGAHLVKSLLPSETPKELADELVHIILSHHGEKEFGSPVTPMTTEAFAVHTLDVASSKLNSAYTNIHNNLGSEKYTPYIPSLKTELYRSPYADELINEDIPF